MLRATIYIHSANVIHRDLKHSNLLLSDSKVCDLDSKNCRCFWHIGVRRWFTCCFVIISFKVNYIGNENALKSLKNLPKRTNETIYFSALSKSKSAALDLLSRMLTFNPNRRLSIEECLAHPYFEVRLK